VSVSEECLGLGLCSARYWILNTVEIFKFSNGATYTAVISAAVVI
jgi:hypothetical protein